MRTAVPERISNLTPWVGLLLAFAVFLVWFRSGTDPALSLRLPGSDFPPGAEKSATNAVLLGKLLPGSGKPAASIDGAWPQFRGQKRDGLSTETVRLSRNWNAGPPKELWSVDLGEGYAGAAVASGRVYLTDYDQAHRQDAIRCLSLADGQEIWRFAYPVNLKRNHGMSRSVPAVSGKFLVTIGPKCHVACLDAETGELQWGLDMVRQFGATVPPWYTGQCPLVEKGKVILAPGGKGALLAAVDLATGKTIWQTPNPRQWKMTHSSVMPMMLAGRETFVYCANQGVVGVSADDGKLLWETTAWKISLATVPSPLVVDDRRIFLSGGYDAGSMMIEVSNDGGVFSAKPVFKLDPKIFGATQHTPILQNNSILGVRPDGQFVALDLSGKVTATSGAGSGFGLGNFLVVTDGVAFAMNDNGKLSLVEIGSGKIAIVSQAQVLHGHESWGPLALAGGRLLARDFTRMVCLDVAEK